MEGGANKMKKPADEMTLDELWEEIGKGGIQIHSQD